MGQEAAKDLIGESLSSFEQQGRVLRAADAQIELAYCYWREGAFDEARVLLQKVIEGLDEDGSELRLVRCSASSRRKLGNQIQRLTSHPATLHHSLKQATTTRLKVVFITNSPTTSNRFALAKTAPTTWTARSWNSRQPAFHFELAGHTRYRSVVEKILGYSSTRLAD